ncbi:hypothetical protein FNF27_04734 [Cafeteria roenbergensis]|uniref:Mon2/Sec7/BIG1-like dimerisation and cyclophilin-binding domain-containing protein n=1 Tax=Cafeteria roenbergensis TaxID=33653 RepID=A0A5A8E7U7_CAFRO|nr:hypothetical protein FNF27_04734 [Cafeteria roenbergensis]
MGTIDPAAISSVLGCLRLSAGNANATHRLRVLQSLTLIMTAQSVRLGSSSIAEALSICCKMLDDEDGSVARTAEATLRQLVPSVFDRLARETAVQVDEAPAAGSSAASGGGVASLPSGSAFEAGLALLQDLTLAVRGLSPRWLSAHEGASGAVMAAAGKTGSGTGAMGPSSAAGSGSGSGSGSGGGGAGSGGGGDDGPASQHPISPTTALELLETTVVSHASLICGSPALLKAMEALVLPTLGSRLPDEQDPQTSLRLFRLAAVVACEFAMRGAIRDSLDALLSVLVALLREASRGAAEGLDRPADAAGSANNPSPDRKRRIGSAAARVLARARARPSSAWSAG